MTPMSPPWSRARSWQKSEPVSGMVEVMGAVMGAATEEVTVGGMGTAKAQALGLPVLSRAPTAIATTANAKRVTSLVEDMATGEAMARNTATVEWKENTATAIIANARTGLVLRVRVVMDTREAAVAEIIKPDILYSIC